LQRINNKRSRRFNTMPRSTKERTKGWYDKRMRKKECDIGDKMLMDSSSKEKLQVGRENHHRSSTPHHMVSSRSNNEGKILR
jgi:hypothetical protein